MQSVDNNGVFGEVMEFTPENLKNQLKKRDINHVQVFSGTVENFEERKALVGKKMKLGINRRYTKAPKSQPRNSDFTINSNNKK